MIGINLKYKKVSITGASHNYNENIKVSDENTLMIKVPHFYEGETSSYLPYKKPHSEETYTISEFYLVLHKMFTLETFQILTERMVLCSCLRSKIQMQLIQRLLGEMLEELIMWKELLP